MRGYQIPFIKQLANGLHSFATITLGNPQLLECYNLMPVEQGLRGHEVIHGIGLTSAYFNYLQIRDQTGVSWYWYPVFDGHILAGEIVPSEPSTGYDAVSLTPTPVPYWVEILDATNVIWYLYPDTVAGWTRARDTKPPVGTGMVDLLWRGTTGEFWKIKYDATTNTRYAVKA